MLEVLDSHRCYVDFIGTGDTAGSIHIVWMCGEFNRNLYKSQFSIRFMYGSLRTLGEKENSGIQPGFLFNAKLPKELHVQGQYLHRSLRQRLMVEKGTRNTTLFSCWLFCWLAKTVKDIPVTEEIVEKIENNTFRQ